MSLPRKPTPTVHFVDQYCAYYQDLFPEVRSFECFKYLHLGLIAELPRKTLPAIARAVGLANAQPLHHFVANSPWPATALRARRLELLKQVLQGRKFTLCIDETGDRKKGNRTDYVARQYLGNVGKIDNGLVSVNAYGVLEGITFPLLFRVYKPRTRLPPGEAYKTKPQLAVELIDELHHQGFQFDLVLADSLYGESGAFIRALVERKLPYLVAIRSNHSVLMLPGQRLRYTRWRAFEREFSNGEREPRYVRELIFGRRRAVRYYQITTDKDALPPESTWWVMTNLTKPLPAQLGNGYGLRTWIEYGFRQSKNELGWADFRLTAYADIEKWWELVFSAYLLVSLQAPVFQSGAAASTTPGDAEQPTASADTPALEPPHPFRQHRWWDTGKGWKNILNNLRLIIQPTIYGCLLLPWLEVVEIPGLRQGLNMLRAFMNDFNGFVPV